MLKLTVWWWHTSWTWEKEIILMEESKETKAARKKVSAMEEVKANRKKYSTETLMGKLLRD